MVTQGTESGQPAPESLCSTCVAPKARAVNGHANPTDVMLLQRGASFKVSPPALESDDQIIRAADAIDFKSWISGAGCEPSMVCHSQGCAEVAAELAVLTKKVKTSKEKLAQCAQHRAALVEDLDKVAAVRAEVETSLQQCAEERETLHGELEQCGKDRLEAERNLQGCGRERAKLEVELRQCAEVDRPAAEKALADCGKERARLQNTLAEIVEDLKSSGASTRRRRRARRSKVASLVELGATVEETSQVTTNLSAEATTALKLKMESLHKALDELDQKTTQANLELEKTYAKASEAEKRLESNDRKADEIIAHEETLNQKEQGIADKLSKLGDRFANGMEIINQMGEAIGTARDSVQESGATHAKALRELMKDMGAHITAATSLLQLTSQGLDLKHRNLALQREESLQTLTALEASLANDEKENKKCDESRAKLVEVRAAVEESDQLLQDCLAAKKVIQSKIEGADKMRESAAEGLEQCLATKEKLKTALENCHRKRDEARKKLVECLQRKSDLKEKINKCHAARDASREKLKKCLAMKQELKAKIMAAKDMSIKRTNTLAEVNAANSPQTQLLQGKQEATWSLPHWFGSDEAQDPAAAWKEALEQVKDSGEELRSATASARESSQELSQLLFDVIGLNHEENQSIVGMHAADVSEARHAQVLLTKFKSLFSKEETVLKELKDVDDEAVVGAQSSKEEAESGSSVVDGDQ